MQLKERKNTWRIYLAVVLAAHTPITFFYLKEIRMYMRPYLVICSWWSCFSSIIFYFYIFFHFLFLYFYFYSIWNRYLTFCTLNWFFFSPLATHVNRRRRSTSKNALFPNFFLPSFHLSLLLYYFLLFLY